MREHDAIRWWLRPTCQNCGRYLFDRLCRPQWDVTADIRFICLYGCSDTVALRPERTDMITQGRRLVGCRYCPAKAVWAIFPATGRQTLVDPQPVPLGNLELTTKGGTLLARVISETERGKHAELYVSHFATCPNRKLARNPRSRTPKPPKR